jgi:Tat protein secretion system quality control protein TatD with DNase activity
VALFSGWDLSRDISTHHLQEKLFDAHCQMARKIHLPLVVRPVLATEKIVEKLTAERGHESEASASNARVVSALGGAAAAASPFHEHQTLQVAVLGLNETAPLADVVALVSLGVYFGIDASFTADGADSDAWTGTSHHRSDPAL